ncbi:GGDEF domain-containing protein [Fimbriimonas ginsengisoli]|uniref:Signal transduction protein n=1 Tax=Fimbriimonas ginsengisoli Gsoil 348 TaxID=661478 RepID=A0A068NSI0_FIMGI|nr:GGDEF domain-containing protein [Fimbriimonas ginsengisoli]AIE86401.1 signal transduction protein [Fimbriimonas ginsengisoli Gsoil 348]
MGLYRFLSKVWRKSSFTTKLLLVAIVGTHALLSSAFFKVWDPDLDVRVVRGLILGERVASIVLTVWMIWALLAPMRQMLRFLQEYDRHGRITELPTEFPDEMGRLMALTHKVVTHLDESVAELAKVSTTDALTGVHNRRFATDRLESDLLAARGAGAEFTLAVIDLDDLKETNTAFGHAGGDESLIGLARTLRAEMGPNDWVARWGGDEFLALFWKATPTEVATRLQGAMSSLQAREIRFSAGLMLASGRHSASEALDAADVALYAAKRAGKNQIRIFEAATIP